MPNGGMWKKISFEWDPPNGDNKVAQNITKQNKQSKE